jgi:hypothetical protein
LPSSNDKPSDALFRSHAETQPKQSQQLQAHRPSEDNGETDERSDDAEYWRKQDEGDKVNLERYRAFKPFGAHWYGGSLDRKGKLK